MTHTLKIGGDPVIPGLALPEAFESVDRQLDSALQLCRLHGSVEGQVLSVVTICQELQHLLKLAFIENGMLASRIEILTRYHNEIVHKMEKKIAQTEVEHKVTRKHMKRLRKRLTVFETLQQKRREQWWEVEVSSSDYDSITILTRSNGMPDLEFMLRINQIMIDFVNDQERNEVVLPPMGHEERQELAKLASIYKLRCRYGKSVQVAPSTLIKARQTSIPAPGEVDAILDNFAKAHKRMEAVEELKQGLTAKETPEGSKDTPPSPSIPPTMLTPLSSLTSPTVEFPPSNGRTPAHSPPTSGLASPTEGSLRPLKDLPPIYARSSSQEKGVGESPLPSRTSQSISSNATSKFSGQGELPPPVPQHLPQLRPPPLILPPPVTLRSTATSTQKSSPSIAGVFVQHHSQLRPLGHPTVVASPLKVPLSHLPPGVQHIGSEGGRESPPVGGGGAPPAKRVRVTRKSIAEEEHSKTA